MTEILEQLGAGAVFACLALPLLTAVVSGQLSSTDPQSRHGVLMWPLVLSGALFGVPWLRQVVAHTAEVSVPAVVLTPLPATPLPDAPPLAMTWSVLGVLGAVWCVLALLGALRLGGQWLRLRRLVSRAAPLDELRLEAVIRRARELGVSAPRSVVSDEVAVPFVTGLLDPVLVLPAALLERLTAEQLDLVLHHELNHLARGDHRVAPLLSLLRLLFPFHPTAAHLMEELALAREEAVDARVEADQLHAYAQLLVTVTAMARERPALVSVLGMADPALKRRVAVLTSRQPRPLARFGPVMLVGLMLIAGGIAAPKAVAAEPPSSPPHADAPPAAEPARTQAPAPDPDADESATISLAAGKEKVLTVPGVQRVAIGDTGVCDVKTIGNNQLLLTGTGAGRTTLLIWKMNGHRVSYMISVTGTGDVASEGGTIALGVGTQKVLTIPDIQRIAIGDAAVCDVRTIGNNQVLLIGSKPGKTSMLVWKSNGHQLRYLVNVRKADQAAPAPTEPVTSP